MNKFIHSVVEYNKGKLRSLSLSAPSSLLLLLPAERQASWEWPKLFLSNRAKFGFDFLAKD